MSAPDTGMVPLAGAPAEDPIKGAIQDKESGIVEDGNPVAPDQFDERFETSRWEIWYVPNHFLRSYH